MIKHYLQLGLGAMIIGMTACGDQAEMETVDGVKYTLITDEAGRTPDSADVVTFDYVIATLDDSVIAESAKEGQPARFQIDAPGYPATLSNALKNFSAGDSAILRVEAEKLFGPQYTPPGISATQPIQMNVKIQKVQTLAEYEEDVKVMRAEEMKRLEQEMAVVSVEEDKQIKSYLDSTNMAKKAEVLESGLVIIKTKTNSRGAMPSVGDKIKAHYEGSLLKGEEFDSSVKRGKPFEFNVGQGKVIQGWDEAFLKLRKGEKATLIIPSRLGYGPNGAGGRIPPNSILKFDVELVDIVK